MTDNPDYKQFSESLANLLKEKNVAAFIINGKTCFPKNDTLKAIISLCEESLEEGDCNKGMLNLESLLKFKKANEIGFLLFDNINKVDILVKRKIFAKHIKYDII